MISIPKKIAINPKSAILKAVLKPDLVVLVISYTTILRL